MFAHNVHHTRSVRKSLQRSSPVHRIAFVGNYAPRKCGIATFTSDLLSAVANIDREISAFSVAVSDSQSNYAYTDVVRFEIEEQDLSSYQRAAEFLNLANVDVVCLQHEFGIFGGQAGGHILAFLRELRMPVVTTLHTILREPRNDQRVVMHELISLSTRLVVMSRQGLQMLNDVYGAPLSKVDQIPHGIPDGAFVDSASFKKELGLVDKTVLLTFGLLSPNKGIENALHSLPPIVAEFPDVVYLVLGATHPNEVQQHGEAYRLNLERLAKKLDIEKHVVFYNRFVDLSHLQEFIGSADVYVTPYLNEAQITSGTLAYTFGSGKAVISTPYWHAVELLADGRGILVPFNDPGAITREILGLLRDPERRKAMSRTAYELGRNMVWSQVARHYLRSFEAARLEGSVGTRKLVAAETLDQKPHELPEVNLAHLSRMTDSIGLFQHAIFSVPNFFEGYCTDDNARAFILMILLEELGKDSVEVRTLATTYAAFLHHAFDRQTLRFHNFMTFDRHWIADDYSEDSQGRALWALGTAVGRSSFSDFQMMAAQLFGAALPTLLELTSPRACAFGLLGIHEYLRRLKGDSGARHAREVLVSRLMQSYDDSSQEDWKWYEDLLAYDNAKLSHALILTGTATGRSIVRDRGLESLRWLSDVQRSTSGYFQPIGSEGFYQRGGIRASFDQQPIEAHATVSACLAAYQTTGEQFWHERARAAFDWFLGWNDLGLGLYSPETGGCLDGLHIDRANRNQGAESMLAFLLSLVEMKLTEDMIVSFNRPFGQQNSISPTL